MIRGHAARRLLGPALLAAAFPWPAATSRESGPVRVSAIGAPPQAGQSQSRAARRRLPPACSRRPRRAWSASTPPARSSRRSRRAGSSPTTGGATPSGIRAHLWADGEPVTAEQVAARLRAATEPRQPQPAEAGARRDRRDRGDDRPGARDQAARRRDPISCSCSPSRKWPSWSTAEGTGPYRLDGAEAGALRLARHAAAKRTSEPGRRRPDICCAASRPRSPSPASPQGEADLVTGGTLGDLPFARAADMPGDAARLRSGARAVRPRLRLGGGSAGRCRGPRGAEHGDRPRRR